MKKLNILILVAILLLSIAGCAATDSDDTTNTLAKDEITDAKNTIEHDFGAKTALEKDDFTIEEMLQYAIQDEYLARQEYEIIMEEYGEINPFRSIIKAEETHIELLKDIYEIYEFEVPEDLAIDYVVLPESLEVAFDIGVQAEIDNIAMYEKFLENDLPDDIYDVFVILRNGSINHLSAFEKGSRGNGAGRNN